MPKPKTQIIPAEDALAADWQDARTMLATVQLHGRLFLLGQVLLGWQLTNIKKSLGFNGRGGDRKSKGQSGPLIRTWEDHVTTELKIPKRTASRFEQLFEAARAKMKRLGGHTKALRLLEKDPTSLGKEEVTALENLVSKITDGETQKNLLIELKLAKQPPKGAAGGKGENEKDDELTAEQMAFIFVTPVITDLAELRISKDYKHILEALPLHGDEDTNNPGLLDIQNQLQAMSAEIEEVLKAKSKTAKSKS